MDANNRDEYLWYALSGPKNPGAPHDSAGGGESYVSALTIVGRFVRSLVDEVQRTSEPGVVVLGADYMHQRAPQWMENRTAAIDGSEIDPEVRAQDPTYWEVKYRKELTVAQAVAEVRAQRRFEQKHDVIGGLTRLWRFLGGAPPLTETHAIKEAEGKLYLQDESRRLREATDSGDGGDGARPGVKDDGISNSSGGEAAELRQFGALVDGDDSQRSLRAAWKVLMGTIDTGKPMAQVARPYRARVGYYTFDRFLDSAPSLIWACFKLGATVGFFLGTATAMQAIFVDTQYLLASGVGAITIINVAVLARVVKWGGNAAVFAAAFCAGDRLATSVKYVFLPAHDAQQRTTFNYVLGLGASGATVGIMPWWILGDTGMACRMAVSGGGLGAVLGLGVGYIMQRLVHVSLARLDVTSRQLRRYEAVMLRERRWKEKEMEEHQSTQPIWW